MRLLLALVMVLASVCAWADATPTPTPTMTPTPVMGNAGALQQYSKTFTYYYGEPNSFSVGWVSEIQNAAQIDVSVENLGASMDVRLNAYGIRHLGKFMIADFGNVALTDKITWTWNYGDAIQINISWWAP